MLLIRCFVIRLPVRMGEVGSLAPIAVVMLHEALIMKRSRNI